MQRPDTTHAVVDAAVHVWQAEDPADPWPAGSRVAAARHRTPLGPDELLAAMGAAGVEKAVLYPPYFVGYRNRFTIDAAAAHPDRFRVMARLDLRHESAAHHLDALLTHDVVAGLRFVFTAPAGAVLADGCADWLWPIAEERGIPIMMLAPLQHEQVRQIATDHPALRIALDHLNLSGEALDGAIAPEIDALLALAALGNVSVKASALPCYSSESYPYASLHPQIGRVIDAFGPSRVFWGSDLSRLRGSYAELVRLFEDALQLTSTPERARIMGGALLDWLAWSG